ncbi:amidase [Pseudonocardia sp. H11422]|uniref:amidase n=1 Tax=Pseudonocardia sp. H11422 TaxID=2835866 RepID=UPI001BDCAD8B|nr:amidase [Pseudonocardia sp. H11422]
MTERSPYLSAVALRALVEDGTVSARELVEGALARIAELDSATTAVVAVRAEAAISEAKAADELPAEQRGALHGVPVLLKDLTETTDLPTTYGSRALKDNYAPAEAVVVTRLREAGAIVVGTTNTPETGLRPTTENLLFGATRNPWNLEHSPGGSSGGAAVALALGMVPLAQATDAAGSGRIPASCCGVVGLKPTRGRVPLAPASYELMAGMGTIAPMARSVEDTALLLDAMSGPVLGDPYAIAGSRGATFADAVSRPPSRSRIGLCMTPPHGTLSPEVREVVAAAAGAFADLGHTLTDADVDFSGLRDPVFTVCAATAAAIVDTVPHDRLGLLEGSTLALARRGWLKTAADHVAAVSTMRNESARLLRAMADYDYIVTPTLTQPPPRVDAFPSAEDLDTRWREYLDWMAFVYPVNCTGQPAISIPAGRTAAGLPVGLQIIGRIGDDAGVLALAAAFAQARPWSAQHPPEPIAVAPAR